MKKIWIVALCITIVAALLTVILSFMLLPTTSTYVCDKSSMDLRCFFSSLKFAIPGCTFVYNQAHNCHLFSCSEAPECCGTTYDVCGKSISGTTYDVTDCEWYVSGVLQGTLKKGESRLIPSGKSSNMYGYKCGGCTAGYYCKDSSVSCYRNTDCSETCQSCVYGCNAGNGQCNPSPSCQDESPCTALTSGQWYCDSFSSTEFKCGNCDGDICIDKCEGMSCVYGCTGNGWGYRCASAPVCTNECSTSGSTRCKDANTEQTCGNYDADTCLEWGNDKSCTYGCVDNKCQGEVKGEINLVFLGMVAGISIFGIILIVKFLL